MRAAVNTKAALFVDSDGAAYPITNWFDDGGECEPEFATVCVAGSGGCWFRVDLAQFEKVETQ